MAAMTSQPFSAPQNLAIMQPTFLPWVGYFALMDRVDRFVFLDDVQFDKRSWQQRNRIKTANGPVWLTVPVLTKGRRDQTLSEAEIQPGSRFGETALKTLEHAYTKAPFYTAVMEALVPVFQQHDIRLCDLNLGLIKAFCDLMGLRADTVRSSETPVQSAKAQRLADLCRVHGATTYISPPGSKDYLEDDPSLSDSGIELQYFSYEHPEWPQRHGAFEPYMSVVDLVMNALPDALTILRSGLCEEISA